MIIDVSSILKEFGGKVDLQGEVQISQLEFWGNTYSFKTPFIVSGSIMNNGSTLIMKADCKTVVLTQCARCTKDIEVPMEFSVYETLMQGEETSEEMEDVIVFDGHEVSVDEIIENNFIMNLSARYLCSEDCKGLCTKCGADLNIESCDCNKEDIDPRWAALEQIMKNND